MLIVLTLGPQMSGDGEIKMLEVELDKATDTLWRKDVKL
jgi:hypothetical protein